MDKKTKNYLEDLTGNAKIKVIGVGGGGGNAVARMEAEQIQGVELFVANTDNQAMNRTKIKNQILIGEKLTSGLGAGANPEIGKKAATESEDVIKNAIKDADMLFVAVGLGGGTGTGAAPVIAKIAKEMGILTVAVVTKPFTFEGPKRRRNAEEGFAQLQEVVDSIIVIPNDNILSVIGTLPMTESFAYADSILKQGVQSITDLITMPAHINLDFADVKATLSNKGKALFGVGAAKGSNRAREAAMDAINSPLLEASIIGADSAIVNITAGPDFTLQEALEVTEVISQESGTDIDLIWGFATSEKCGDECIVTIIATGLENENKEVLNYDNLRKDNFSRQSFQQPAQATTTFKQPEVAEEKEETFLRTAPQKAQPKHAQHLEEEPKSRRDFLNGRELFKRY